MDEDGKAYLYHVRLKDGNRIYVAEMTNDLSGIKKESLTECISAEVGWEDTGDVEWKVSEGPTVFLHKGLYYMFYSANDFRNPDYAVGFAVSETPEDPWKKYSGNPIIDRSLVELSGTGHGDVFWDEDGDMKYVFHTQHSPEDVRPRKVDVINLNFREESNFDVIEAYKSSFNPT